jgi:hypothetical protein
LRPVDKFWIAFGKVSAVIWSLLALGGVVWGAVRFLRERLSVPARQRRRLQALRRKLAQLPPSKDEKKTAGQIRQILVDALAVRLGDESRAWTSPEAQEKTPALLEWTPEQAEALGTLLTALQATEFAGFPLDPQSRELCGRIMDALEPKDPRKAG